MTEPEPPVSPSENLCRIVSYNIHQCVGLDGRYDAGRIARILRDLQGDIVGLQEVNAPFGADRGVMQLDFLADSADLRAIGAPTIERHDSHYGNALLTRGKILDVRRFDISFPRREARGALDVELEIRDRPLRVIITHLGLVPAERRYQVKRLLQIIDEYPLKPVILLGDLNEWFLLGRPARWLHQHFGRPPAPRTFPAYFPVLSLDRILVQPQQALKRLWVIRSRDARVASDHLPLVADIRLDEAGA